MIEKLTSLITELPTAGGFSVNAIGTPPPEVETAWGRATRRALASSSSLITAVSLPETTSQALCLQRIQGAFTITVPDGEITYQRPPLVLIAWPLAVPAAESAA
jgi:hypothetical protein